MNKKWQIYETNEAEINKIVNEFNPSWISEKVDRDMIVFTEKAGQMRREYSELT